MKFYKYRKGWSSGISKWEYVRLPEGETPKSFFEEMERQYEWSEHFRGIEYRKAMPPKEWFEKEIDDMRESIKHSQNLICQYRKLI
jgi:hypothetical protein